MHKMTLGLVVTALLIGCSTPGLRSTSDPVITRLTPVRTSADIHLPLQAYRPSSKDVLVVHAARAHLTRECAARFGVIYSDQTPAEPDVTTDAMKRRYGIVDHEEAASFGYRIPAPAPDPVPYRTPTAPDWRPSANELVVVLGATVAGHPLPFADRPLGSDGRRLPEGGCWGEAENQLNGGLKPVNPSYLDALEGESFMLAEHDWRVVDAWQRWSQCMRKRGHNYSAPWDPNDKDWGAELRQPEIDTALDDVTCRNLTSMTDIWMAVEVAYQRRLIVRHAADLDVIQRFHDRRLQRSEEVLATADGS